MRATIPLILVLLVGCTPPSSPPPVAGGPGAPVSTAPGTPRTGAPEAQPSAAATALPILESRDAASGDIPVTVAVNSVHTAPGATVVNFTFTNRGQRIWYVDRSLSSSYLDFDVSGVFLVDAVAGKRYLPARDSEQRCACSPTRTGGIGAGRSVTYSAVFAPLPADAKHVGVHIPVGGTFDVPVTR